MFYRYKQFIKALFPRIYAHENAWLDSFLTEKELILFKKQSLAEQRHGLDVAKDIEYQRDTLEKLFGGNHYINLIKASLLHDCGKSMVKLYLWQRVTIVMINRFPLKMQKKIIRKRNILGKTLLIYNKHPNWGKHLAAKAGLDIEVQDLILNHHAPTNPSGNILFQADNRN